MSLCTHQSITNEPCPNGLSRAMTCNLGYSTTCINRCQPETCGDFAPVEREDRRKEVGVRSRGAVREHHSNSSAEGGGCGCGKNESIAGMVPANTYYNGGNISYE